MTKELSGSKKILIIRLSSIGDILLTTPLIRSIKKQNPVAQIDFLVKEDFFLIVKNNPHLTEIYNYPKDTIEKQKLISILKSNKYDIIIDLQNNLRSSEVTRQLRTKTFKFKKKTLKKFLLVKFKINFLKNSPLISIRYAKSANVELDDEGLELYTDEIADSRLTLNAKYIGLCPGAKHFTKRWPKEYFVELGNMLESSGYKVVLFGGPGEIGLSNELAEQLTDPINLSNENILRTAANMKMCRVIYTNDSGTMHLASAMKIPVVAFFGSTVKEFGFFPYKVQNIVLEVNDLSCRPCSHIGRKSCPLTHFKCMRNIIPDTAFRSLNRFQIS